MAACLLASFLTVVTVAPSGAENTALLPPLLGTGELQASDPRSGLALFGYDPVSYFMEAAPRPGRAAVEATWGGFGWRFASEANRAAFLRDPEAFLPRIGGYDAAAAAAGRLAVADPLIYLVRSGRLYLFRTDAGRSAFAADPAGEEAAEGGWLILRRGLVAG